MTLTRQTILSTLKTSLEPLPYVYCMWEGGAVSFNRADEWSDIDLQVNADDDRVDEVVAIVEAALKPLSAFTLRYELPQPTWHGGAQVFYQFEQASPFLLLDFVVFKRAVPESFLSSEIHGEAVIHFDKADILKPPPFDWDAHQAKIQKRVEALRVTFPLFQTLVLKEAYRRNHIEAMAFYNGYTLKPLLEVLRIKYCPARFDFASRYVYYDLPRDVVQMIEPLYFVSNATDLLAKREKAERLFNEMLAVIDKEFAANSV